MNSAYAGRYKLQVINLDGSLNPPSTKSNLQKLTLQGEATWARTAVPE